VPTVSNNSSSSCVSPQGIVNEFMSLGGVQLPSNNESQLTGSSQGTLSNNTYMNNSLCNTVTITTTTNHSSPNTSNNADFPKVYKSTIPSIVEVTSYNRTNHTIFKTGTGFIYDFNGTSTIITVSNLVAGKSDLTVTLPDGSSYYSNLTGYDPLTNIAILSVKNIPQNKLVPLQLGNSSTLEEGQQVLTVGNTMGLKNQITSGIISGLEQPIPVLSKNSSISLPKMPIGISTSLNLGNGYGGSPLLDTNGKVIGMNIGNYTLSNLSYQSNTAVISSSPPSNIGISFAVPSNTILKIVPSLLSKGY
jgi:putative serine protease PepD